jgi:hypothetical protein
MFDSIQNAVSSDNSDRSTVEERLINDKTLGFNLTEIARHYADNSDMDVEEAYYGLLWELVISYLDDHGDDFAPLGDDRYTYASSGGESDD